MLISILIIVALIICIIAILWRHFSERYSIPCPSWLAGMVEIDNPFVKNNRAQTIVKHLNPKIGSHVLDAGCGPGRLTIPLAKTIGQSGLVTAMDIQEKMLKKVEKKASLAHLNNITFLHAGLGQGKLAPNVYDYAVLVHVLGEIPNRESALQEIFDALKPNGILSVTEIVFDPHYQRHDDVVRLAENVGFKKIKKFGNWLGYTVHFQK